MESNTFFTSIHHLDLSCLIAGRLDTTPLLKCKEPFV